MLCLLLASCAKYRLRKNACDDPPVFEKFSGGYFFMPNAFSPSSNGTNDWLRIKYSGVSSFKLEIKDHLGRIVYESSDIVDWVGQSMRNGKKMPSDNYPYCLEFTSNSGEKFSKKGKLSLLNGMELYQKGFTEKYCFDNYESCVFESQWQGDTLPFKSVTESGEYFGTKCE